MDLLKLGFDVTLHGLIGDDEYGQKLFDYFATTPINFLYDIDPTGTKRHVNLMDKEGGRISIFIHSGTFEPEADWLRLEPAIAQADIVALNIINYGRYAIPLIKKHNKVIWCDIHDYNGQAAYHQDFIDAADVLFMSSDALPDYRPFMQKQIANGKKLIICTHGSQGSTTLTTANEWIETTIIPAYDAAKVDTNGAGDAFFSGALAMRMDYQSKPACAGARLLPGCALLVWN